MQYTNECIRFRNSVSSSVNVVAITIERLNKYICNFFNKLCLLQRISPGLYIVGQMYHNG
jgi:hypothetical protein